MTITERIISYLRDCPEGIDDDDLAKNLGLKFRQQANARCRQLEIDGVIERRQVDGKIHNFLTGKSPEPAITFVRPKGTILKTTPSSNIWFWEGNVQSKIVADLVLNNYHILSEADTASHERGVDIVAEKDGVQLWVTVKGYPRGTDKTRPSTQASHWFKHAIFDILVYREQGENISLAVALPDFPRYHDLAKKISWVKREANFLYFWVKNNGEVFSE